MAVLEILTYPNPILREVAQPVAEVNDEIRALVEDMAETMYAAGGVGLAANQIGVAQRIFVIDIAGEDEPSDLMVFINPELSEPSGTQAISEGCLSFPGASEIKRAERLHVRALNAQGETFELQAEGFLAIAIQHENDHIDGVLMIDKVGPIARRKISRQVARARQESVA